MAMRITITVNEPGDEATMHRFGAKLMEALQAFDSTTEIKIENPMSDRAEACVRFLQDTFGMEPDEARGAFEELEAKRIARETIPPDLLCPDCQMQERFARYDGSRSSYCFTCDEWRDR